MELVPEGMLIASWTRNFARHSPGQLRVGGATLKLFPSKILLRPGTMAERVRSKFLVHWTGKDIDVSGRPVIDVRTEYSCRLLETLATGLWLTPCRELLVGGRGGYEFTVPMTCFTEIRLSAAQGHASRYGRLGFGFDRLFVLGSGGSPVVYVQPSPDNSIMQRLSGILGRLDGLESFMVADGNIENSSGALRDTLEARELLQQLCAFVKVMSVPGTDDFQFLEEAEWRVAYNEIWSGDFGNPRPPSWGHLPIAARSLMEDWSRPRNIVPTGRDRPPFFLQFTSNDLRFLIFPDDQIRKDISQSRDFRRWLTNRTSPLPMLTLEECFEF